MPEIWELKEIFRFEYHIANKGLSSKSVGQEKELYQQTYLPPAAGGNYHHSEEYPGTYVSQKNQTNDLSRAASFSNPVQSIYSSFW